MLAQVRSQMINLVYSYTYNPARAAREARAVYPYFEFKDQPGSCPAEKTWRRQRGRDLAEKAMDAPAKTKVSCFLILSH